MEMVGSLVVRRELRKLRRTEGVSVPAQRADQPATHQPAPGEAQQPAHGEGHATATSSRSDHRNTPS
jgi:hypothetical protein